MQIRRIELKNIGPFKNESMDFAYDLSDSKNPAVTIITGLNGAGKSILVDAIRTALSGNTIERNIVADPDDFRISIDLNSGNGFRKLTTKSFDDGAIKYVDWSICRALQYAYKKDGGTIFPWIVDYWSSKLPSDSFVIDNMNRINHYAFMEKVMTGRKRNLDLTNFLCNIDYMRGSDVKAEKTSAEFLFNTAKGLINKCLDNGRFLYIKRQDLMPVFEQNGQQVTLEKLSSGNIFLIEHLILLMSKMYSLSIIKNTPTEDILKTPGLLLIDEIETHLHPRWQKSILPIIHDTFPNLQIILTTHSPFVLSSIQGARIYTCKPKVGFSIIEEETYAYSTLPVDQILLSDAFNVAPFNNEITQMMVSRKNAISEGNPCQVEKIEAELIDVNPVYFSYINNDKIDSLLQKLKEIE